ncbi:MAG TPA: flagellar biosynthesis anti-sigma factor FlgM [Nitrococcus sp.]|nr:flagellar biosynthesis anti-sigma factor FlgM [Nitrococcus sp.]
MTNPIDNGPRVTRPQLSGADRTYAEAEPGATAAKASAAMPGDTNLQSDRLQAVYDAIEHTPEIDRSRVEEISERIARGDYPLNVERIAERFTAFEKLLHG